LKSAKQINVLLEGNKLLLSSYRENIFWSGILLAYYGVLRWDSSLQGDPSLHHTGSLSLQGVLGNFLSHFVLSLNWTSLGLILREEQHSPLVPKVLGQRTHKNKDYSKDPREGEGLGQTLTVCVKGNIWDSELGRGSTCRVRFIKSNWWKH